MNKLMNPLKLFYLNHIINLLNYKNQNVKTENRVKNSEIHYHFLLGRHNAKYLSGTCDLRKHKLEKNAQVHKNESFYLSKHIKR